MLGRVVPTATAMDSTLCLSPGKLIGPYRIERELGRGGTAIVYLARMSMGASPVAVKALRRELLESMSAEQFLKEIRHTAALDHPRIVPLLDSGTADRELYFVL